MALRAYSQQIAIQPNRETGLVADISLTLWHIEDEGHLKNVQQVMAALVVLHSTGSAVQNELRSCIIDDNYAISPNYQRYYIYIYICLWPDIIIY